MDQCSSLPDVKYLENHCLICLSGFLIVSEGRVTMVTLLLHLDQKFMLLCVSCCFFFSYQYGFFFCARLIFTHCLFIVSFLETVTFFCSSCLFVCLSLALVFASNLQMSCPCVKCPALTELPGCCGTGPMIQKKTWMHFPHCNQKLDSFLFPPPLQAVGHNRPYVEQSPFLFYGNQIVDE